MHACVEPDRNSSHPVLEAFFIGFSRVHGYLGVVVCTFGIASNLANIAVLTRPNMVSATNWLLVWLAVADLLTMVAYLPQLCHFFILQEPEGLYLHTDNYRWIQYNQFVASFVIVCHSAAIWLGVALAVFRYFFIIQKLRRWPCSTQRNVTVAILIIYTLSVLVTMPNMFLNRINACALNDSRREAALSSTGEARHFEPHQVLYEVVPEGPDYLQAINFWLQAIVVKIVPCIILTLMTVLIIVQLRSARITRMSLLRQDSRRLRQSIRTTREIRDNRTTIMLLFIVVLFILTELPQGVLVIWIHIEPSFYWRVYYKLGDVIDFITLCNESINFILYTSMSYDFRKTFSKMFFHFHCPTKAIKKNSSLNHEVSEW